MPASRIEFQDPKCVPVPKPEEPNFSSPGFAFAAATSSPTVVMPASLPATNTRLAGERSDRDEILQRVIRQVLQKGRRLYAWALVFTSNV